MKSELMTFLSQFHSLTSEEMGILADLLTVRELNKGTILVKEGQVCNECYFVLKGCLRQYMIIDGIEKTTQFYTENQTAVFFTSYSNLIPSESYLACVEDSLLIVGEPAVDTELYKKFPKLEQITRAVMEQDMGKTQDSLSKFIISTPEERYLDLLQTRPALLQRVSQHQLASFIGVTPESLSRIRKRLVKMRRS